jgi:hypothetical protein
VIFQPIHPRAAGEFDDLKRNKNSPAPEGFLCHTSATRLVMGFIIRSLFVPNHIKTFINFDHAKAENGTEKAKKNTE